MLITLATEKNTKQLVDFFDKNLKKDNKAIHSREFFCPFGVRSAVKKNRVMLTLDDEKIIAAVRFYPRKRDAIVSVYQFAIDINYRRNSLLQKMLQEIRYDTFEFICPKDIEFNTYYEKIGAKIN